MSMNFSNKTHQPNKTQQPNQKVAEAQNKDAQKSRRTFLDLVAKSGIASSTLRYSSLLGGIMTARYAQAQETPKRVVYCYIHSGAPADWKPASATNITGSSFHYGSGSHNVASICHFRGVDTEVAGHGGARQALGGDYSRPTVDTDLGPLLGPRSYYSTIFLGSNAADAGAGAGTIISNSSLPVEDPQQALQKYFGALPEVGNDDTYLLSFEAQRRAAASIKNKLSTAEHARLDAHLTAIEKIESRIKDLSSAAAPDLNACKPTIPTGYNDSTNAGMVAHAKLQADIIVAAFKCDLTRVAVLQIGNHQGGGWTYQGFDGHSAAHSGGTSVWNPMMREKFEVPAYFIKKLTTTLDSNGQPLINSTAFCQVSCFGNGLSHASSDAPFLLATRMPSFRSGFSSKGTTSTSRDFHAEVVKGLGIDPSGLNLSGATGGNVDLVL
jgi:Protein of unknown function (DUF1552)